MLSFDTSFFLNLYSFLFR